MSGCRSHRAGLVAAAILAVAAAPASGAERTVADVHTPTRQLPVGATTAFPVIDAAGGRVVWSDYDRAGDVWRLMQAAGGRVGPVPVRPRPTPFDVDLAPDGASAVYTRCARRLPRDEPAVVPGRHVRFGCDVHRFDFARGRERRVAAVSSSGDEAWPATDGSRIAFVRTYPQRPGRRGTTPYLYWRRASGGAPSRRLRRPSSAVRVNGGTVYLPFRIMGLDLAGDTVAYTWRRQWDEADQDFVFVATTGGRLHALADGASRGGGAGVTSRSQGEPALGGSQVRWLFESSGEPQYAGAFLRRSVGGRGRPRGRAAVSRQAPKAVAFAAGRGTVFWIDGGAGADDTPENQPGGTFPLRAEDRPAFAPGIPAGWLTARPPGS